MKIYPDTRARLGAVDEIVSFPEFENGVVKVLNDDQQRLTETEINAISGLKIENSQVVSSHNLNDLNWAQRALKWRKLSKSS